VIRTIEHLGKLIDDCTLPGESRADGVAPAHGNGIQLSRDRFLLLNSTLRFRGVDDNCSIVWQLRRDSYTGPVIREGFFARSTDDWYPLGERYRCVKQMGHPVAFGVPRGARLGGRDLPHANRFVVKWRIVARVFVPEGGYLLWQSEPPEVRARTQDVQWLQFRLSDDGNDLIIDQPIQSLRMAGYESSPPGDAICPAGAVSINQTYVQAVPFNADASEWADVCHFVLSAPHGSDSRHNMGDTMGVAAMRYRFHAATGRYQWVQMGPVVGPGVFEGNLSPHGSDWILAARATGADRGIAFARLNDPFTQTPTLVKPEAFGHCNGPLTVYKCPDGVTRLATGDPSVSPYKSGRDPIYLWDLEPDRQFQPSARHQIYSPRQNGNPIPHEHEPLADMIKLLPHAGGTTQTLIHRVRTCALAVTHADYPSRIRPLTPGDFSGSALYHASVRYDQPYPSQWSFT
jgi:hypothetical protein